MEAVFKTEPRSYQREAFDRFKDRNSFALMFDMGLGKTKTAIDIAVYKYLRGEIEAVMLIAPNGVHVQWVSEQMPLHCKVDWEAFIWDSAKLGRKYYKAEGNKFFSKSDRLKLFAINVEAFSSKTVLKYADLFIQRFPRVMIILDESTRIKNPSANRSKAIMRYNGVGVRCILTGTPAAKDPYSIYNQYEFLQRGFFNMAYIVFQHKYGLLMSDKNFRTGRSFKRPIAEKDYAIIKHKLKKMREHHGDKLTQEHYFLVATSSNTSESVVRFIDSQEKYVKYRNLEELRDTIAPVTISVKKDDVADLPPKIYATSYVLMSKEQEKVYNDLKESLRARYAGEELSVTSKLTLMLRLLQVCGGFFPFEEEGERRGDVKPIGSNPKLERIIDELEEVDFEETKCIVWAAFVPELLLLYKELSKTYSCCLYYGGVSKDERVQILEDFKAGKYDIFIGNIQTAAYGLNLQNATVQLYYSNNFRTEDRLQAENRSHRIGTKNTVVYKDIVAKGTVDELCVKAIQAGRDLNEFFKDMSLEEILG